MVGVQQQRSEREGRGASASLRCRISIIDPAAPGRFVRWEGSPVSRRSPGQQQSQFGMSSKTDRSARRTPKKPMRLSYARDENFRPRPEPRPYRPSEAQIQPAIGKNTGFLSTCRRDCNRRWVMATVWAQKSPPARAGLSWSEAIRRRRAPSESAGGRRRTLWRWRKSFRLWRGGRECLPAARL